MSIYNILVVSYMIKLVADYFHQNFVHWQTGLILCSLKRFVKVHAVYLLTPFLRYAIVN